MTPDVSIIIVNWNTCDLLRACLASIDRYGVGVDVETIVVDNASTDGSCAMVERTFPHVRLLRQPRNRGFGVANNIAMRHVRGRYVLLLNSDAELTPGVLRASIDAMDAHDDIGVLGVRVHHPDDTLQLTCFAEPTITNVVLQILGLHRLRRPAWFGRDRMRWWSRDTVRDVDVVTGCYFMVRPDTMRDVGLFDEQFFFYGEETDWCRRIRARGWAVRFMPVGTIIHHGGASADMLDADRGVLLGDGIVRFHRKHAGVASAAIVWGLLFVGNIARATGYGMRGLLPGQSAARSTAGRFARVALRFTRAWPGRARSIEPSWSAADVRGDVGSDRRAA